MYWDKAQISILCGSILLNGRRLHNNFLSRLQSTLNMLHGARLTYLRTVAVPPLWKSLFTLMRQRLFVLKRLPIQRRYSWTSWRGLLLLNVGHLTFQQTPSFYTTYNEEMSSLLLSIILHFLLIVQQKWYRSYSRQLPCTWICKFYVTSPITD